MQWISYYIDFFGVTLLSSYVIDSSLTLISNKLVHRHLVGIKNHCIGYKDYDLILVGFYLSMKILG
jgi:hypothetical protein